MLVNLSIRNIVLIDQLDLPLGGGLTVLTGETGAGKSILLDAFSLTLGARGDGALVREGEAQGQVTAVFELSLDHPALAAANAQDIETDGGLDSAPGATGRWPHPRLRQRPARHLAGAARDHPRTRRNSRPARRSRAGRFEHASPVDRRLWRPGSAARAGSARRMRACANSGPSARARRSGSKRRAPTPIICATLSPSLKSSTPEPGEEEALAGAPRRHDAGRESRRRPARRRRGCQRRSFADVRRSPPHCAGCSAARRRRPP